MKLYKIRKTKVQVEEEERAVIRTEILIIVQCNLSDAYHAIYRTMNQVVATRLRVGAYVFDVRGCKYPDRTLCSLPINIQQIKDRLRVNLSIENTVYMDIKIDRVRAEDRKHLRKKVKGGYPVERIMGTADLPTYRETLGTQSILSIEPPGPLLGEKNRSSNKSTSLKSNNVSEMDRTNKSSLRPNKTSIPSNLNGRSGMLLGERDSSIKSASLMLPTKTVKKSSCAFLVGRDEQRSRQSKASNNNPPSVVDHQQIAISQNRQQSMIFYEIMDFTQVMNRTTALPNKFT